MRLVFRFFSAFIFVAFLCFLSPSLLTAQEAAPSETQDFSGDWAELESDHFTMLYPLRREAFARHTLVYAEHAYAQLAQKLDVDLSFKITIKLIDRVDEVIPYSESVKSDSFILTTWPPQNLLDGPYRGDWLERTVYHHVANILIQNTRIDISQFLQILFLPLTYNNHFLPTWYIEGLSAWYETVDAPGMAIYDAVPNSVLRSDAIYDEIPKLGGLMSGRRSWLGKRTPLFYGSAFIYDVAKQYGESALTRWNHENMRLLIPFTINVTTNKVFGNSWDAIYEEWHSHKTEHYIQQENSDAANFPYHPRSFIRSSILTTPWHHEYPQMIPNKNAISYVHDDGTSARGIVIHDFSTGEETKVAECHGRCEHHWSADGETLFFTNLVTENRHRSETLYVYPLSHVLSTKFNIPDHIRCYAVSDRAVYAVIEDGDAPLIYRTFLEDGAEPELIYTGNTFELIEDIVWMEGNRFIASVSNADTRVYDLFEFVDVGGTFEPRQLTFSDTTEMYPFKMGDGSIGYITYENDLYLVHALDPQTGQNRIVHAQRDSIFHPVQSDDGSLYYTSITADGMAIRKEATLIFPRFIPASESPAPDLHSPREPISALYKDEIEMVRSLTARPYRVWQSFIPTQFMPVVGYTQATGAYIGIDMGNDDVLEHHHYDLHYAYYIRRNTHAFSLLYRWSQYKWWFELYGGCKQDTYTYDFEGKYYYFPFQTFFGKFQTGTTWRHPNLDIQLKLQYLLEYNQMLENSTWNMVIQYYNDTVIELLGDEDLARPYFINRDVYARPTKTNALIADLELSHLHQTYRTLNGETGYRLQNMFRVEAPFLGADYYSIINELTLSMSWSMPWIDTHVLLLMLKYGFSFSNNEYRNAFRVAASTHFEFNEPLMLHGYHTGHIIGNQLLYAHTDYTFPVAEIQSAIPNIPIGLNRIGLGIYGEAALVWNELNGNDFMLSNLKSSVGIDAYIDGILGYNYNFRLKFGYGIGLTDDGDHNYYIEFSFTP